MGALPQHAPRKPSSLRPSAPQATAAVTLAWIRALASDWRERRESQELARRDLGSRSR